MSPEVIAYDLVKEPWPGCAHVAARTDDGGYHILCGMPTIGLIHQSRLIFSVEDFDLSGPPSARCPRCRECLRSEISMGATA